MSFAIKIINSKTGRQTGYAVYDLNNDETVATFTNRALCTWRNAKAAAERKCAELNQGA